MVSAEDEVAVNNLVAAFDNEMSAHARYLAFAGKADEEGLGGIASLFRASARAEQIHADNHARVIRHMGGDIDATPQSAEVRTTLENLSSAESFGQVEINSLYPTFIRQVSSHLDTRVERTLTLAVESEKSHLRLHSSARSLLEAGKTSSWIGTAQGFQVCSVCGYIAETREGDSCPVCNFPWERFIVVR